MTNAWSFLYDEMTMTNFEDRYEDGLTINFTDTPITISGAESSDTIHCYGANDVLNGSYFSHLGGGQDTISFSTGTDTISFDRTMDNMPEINLNLDATAKNGFWKYEEDKTMKEVRDYLSGTYKSHYTSQDSKTQTLDLIESIGDGEPFCRSNAIKYLSRFGKKNGKSKQDILKAIHYCILLYHFAGLHNETKGTYETF